MSTRGAGRRAWRAACVAVASVAAVSLAACGSTDVDSKPRPPAPIEVTARVDSSKVVVSPDRFGSGLVNITIANLSDSPVHFTLSGPKHAASPEIQPGAPAAMKVDLPQGSYQASAGQGTGPKAATVTVGPERKSSQNQLLLP
jgi:hypothetical protein